MLAITSQVLLSLQTTPQTLLILLREVPPDALRWTPASWQGIPGERFCIADQFSHLRDIEIDGYHLRIQRTLVESSPHLESLDSYNLAKQHRYDLQSPNDSLEQLAAARETTIKLLRKLSQHELARRATFAEYGEITLLGLIRFLCSHDQQHLACMHWLLGKLSSR